MIEEILKDILAELKKLNAKKGKDEPKTQATVVAPVAETVVQVPVVQVPVAAVEAPKTEVKVYTDAEVGTALTNLCAKASAKLVADGTDAAAAKAAGFTVGRAILTKHGAQKVGGLKPEQYAAVMADITEASK